MKGSVLEIAAIILISIMVLAISLKIVKISKNATDEIHVKTSEELETSYYIERREIKKLSNGNYQYNITLKIDIKSNNYTTVIPVVFYKYNYFKCKNAMELHLKKGEKKTVVCDIDFETDYSPTIEKCNGSLDKHETIKCGNISFMIDDVIDVYDDAMKIDDMLKKPEGRLRMFYTYLNILYGKIMRFVGKPDFVKKNMDRFVALVTIDDGTNQYITTISYNLGCRQCYLKANVAADFLNKDIYFWGGCSDEYLNEYSRTRSNFRLIEKKTEDFCSNENNEVEITYPTFRVKISIDSVRYYPSILRIYDSNLAERVGFEEFSMKTYGGSFKKAAAPMDIIYVKPGCVLMDTATTSDQVYKAMDMCKNLVRVKSDRIWVDDSLG